MAKSPPAECLACGRLRVLRSSGVCLRCSTDPAVRERFPRSEAAEQRASQRTTHGGSHSPEWAAHKEMKGRCLNPRHQNYSNYGGRGVTVCERWAGSFAAFLADVGPKPGRGYSLDRIDGSRGYEPGNVRWATRRSQCNNLRTNVRITRDGITLTAAEWSRLTGIPAARITSRYHRGLPVDRVFHPGLLAGGRGKGQPAATRRASDKSDNSAHKLKLIFYAMRARCLNPSNASYPRYGGRGITVCERWTGRDGLANFLADMGPRPSANHSLDRVDNGGPYSPDNCRWLDSKSQARNTRRNRVLTVRGEARCVSEWAERTGVPPWLILQRVARGWSPERAVLTKNCHNTHV